MSCDNIRDIYLKIETIEDYSAVEPYDHVPQYVQYKRDCMRFEGHEDGTIPDSEVDARRLDALVYREYLDPDYLIPKVDKLIQADINEPAYHHRVPGTVIYAKPGDLLRIHVHNADRVPHSFHLHGLRYGIDSDGAWPLGVENADGLRSDEICPGQSWTYIFCATPDTVGVWPFHDHHRMAQRFINRGLFGGIVVLPKGWDPPKPPRYKPIDELRDILKRRFRKRVVRRFDPAEVVDWRKRLHFLDEWLQVEIVKPVPEKEKILHVPLFFHVMQDDQSRPLFDTEDIPEMGGVRQLVFNDAGSFDYFCRYHPSMEGTVNVTVGGPDPADVYIVDNPVMGFSPQVVNVGVGGTVRWNNQSQFHHTATAKDGASMATHCFNGRGFVGNSPTIVGHTGQKIRWYVFNLDVGHEWHNFHPHSSRWRLGDENIDVRSLGPAESFMVETEVPPVLMLDKKLEKIQNPKYRPKRARRFDLKGDYLFHCHVHHHAMNGMMGLIRAKQSVWLTRQMVAELTQTRGLPLDGGTNLCPEVDLNRCRDKACGTWEEIADHPQVVMMHAAMLPGTQKALIFGKNRDDQTRVFDIAAETFAPPAINQPADLPGEDQFSSNLWSAEHAFLDTADGKLLVHGGLTAGRVKSYLFDPDDEEWTATGSTADARFYSTSLTLQDGRVITLYGSSSVTLEVYDPAAGAWDPPKALPWNEYHYYPWTYLLPGGDLFIAGPQENARRFDWTANPIVDDPLQTWPTGVGDRANFNGSQQGTSVLLTLRPPAYAPRALIAGGIGATGDSVQTIDLSAASPTWTTEAPLHNSRVALTAVLLPNGKVLVIGGMTQVDPPVGGPAEIWDPQKPGDGWKQCPGTVYHRLYHSSAVLLIDGSVLVGGDDDAADPCERYYPEYFSQPRPQITSIAPASVGYASPFTIDSPQAASIAEVILMRPGAVTHGFDMSQRAIECTITGIAGNTITAESPPDGTVAPPGWYMAFILDGGRVPSPGSWIRLTP